MILHIHHFKAGSCCYL